MWVGHTWAESSSLTGLLPFINYFGLQAPTCLSVMPHTGQGQGTRKEI